MSPAIVYTMRRHALIWLAWTVAGLFYITQDCIPRLYRNEPVPWLQVFTGWMISMYICAVLTPAVLWAGRRWPIGERGQVLNIVWHFLFSAAFSLVTTAIEAEALRRLGIFPTAGHPVSYKQAVSVLLVYGFHGGIIRYWAVIGLQTASRAFQRARQREKDALLLQVRSTELARQLTSAQLGALKAQLHPHFLFNTLGAISSLVRQGDRTGAESMLNRLSDLLRAALEDIEEQEVPVWRELEFARLYLAIEQVRFQDRLTVMFDVPQDLQEGLVPHMVLQPIVENAVRHGLGRSEGAVLIRVSVLRAADDLVLSVADDGPGSPGGFERNGIGLSNSKARLDRLYGAAATLHARNLETSGVQVTITFPFHTEPVDTCRK